MENVIPMTMKTMEEKKNVYDSIDTQIMYYEKEMNIWKSKMLKRKEVLYHELNWTEQLELDFPEEPTFHNH